MELLSVERGRLRDAHDQTVAVSISVAGTERTVVGRSSYEEDPELGPVLRIRFGAGEDGELLIAENLFDGELLPGHAAGCDYLLRLS